MIFAVLLDRCPIVVLYYFRTMPGPSIGKNMANKQIVNGIRVYSRHSTNCPHAKNAAYVSCNCCKWLQYQLKGVQRREPAKTRSFAHAKKAAELKDKELRGEAPAHSLRSKLWSNPSRNGWSSVRKMDWGMTNPI